MFDFIIIILIFCVAALAVELRMLTSNDPSTTTKALRSLFLFIICTLLSILTLGYNHLERKIKEKAITEFVQGTVSYDTLTMDKSGKILEIKLIEK